MTGFELYEEDPVNNQTDFLLWLIIFVLMVVFFGFIIGSLFVAAVVTNLDKAMLDQCEDEKREEQKEDFLSGVFDNEEGVTNEEIKSMREREIRMEYLTDFSIFSTQRHKIEKQVLHKCANGKRTSERVEDKLLLLEALDNNFKEYVTYRDQLVEIIEEIKVLKYYIQIWTDLTFFDEAFERSEHEKRRCNAHSAMC